MPDSPAATWGLWPVVRPIPAWRAWALGLVFAAVLFPLTVRPRHSGNVFSRYMMIEAIVERGTLAIERSPLLARSGSPDVVKFGNHLYSDKPPVLPVLATPVYFALYVAGYRFSGPPPQFVVTNLVLTWTVVGLASAWAVVSVRRLLQAVPLRPWVSDLLALGFGFGSQIFSYAVTFNNHSVAAALIVAALALTVLGPDRSRRRFLAGLFAALAATIDLPAGGLMLAGLGSIQAIRVRSVPWAFAFGALGPLLLHAGLQSLVTGSPLPPEVYPEAFQFPGSFWTTPAAAWKEPGPRVFFLFEFLLGPQGWLTITPVLILGLVGAGRMATRRDDPLAPAAWVVGGSILVLAIYYTWVVRRTDFAGSSFGTRHLLPMAPAVYAFAVVELARVRRAWFAGLFAVLWAIGAVYAYEGMLDPWSRVEARRRDEPALRALRYFVIYPWSHVPYK